MRDPRRPRFLCVLGRVGVGAVASACLSAAACLPADAAGYAPLDRQIVGNPIPGWTDEPVSELNAVVSGVQKVEADAAAQFGASTQTAAEGWHAPADGHDVLVVMLIQLSVPHLSTQGMVAQAQTASSAAAAAFCPGATASPPVSDQPLAGLAGSHLATCTAAADGVVPVALVWSKANVMAIMVFTDSLPVDRVASLAQREDAMLSQHVGVLDAGSSGWIVFLGVSVGGALVVALLTFGLVRRRRRREVGLALAAHGAPDLWSVTPTAAPPGWYRDPDTGVQRWWDGSRWTQTGQIPAGWYPDPSVPGAERWWDGAAWGPSRPRS